MRLPLGTRVRVNAPLSTLHGRTGTVTKYYDRVGMHGVELDGDGPMAFTDFELIPITTEA